MALDRLTGKVYRILREAGFYAVRTENQEIEIEEDVTCEVDTMFIRDGFCFLVECTNLSDSKKISQHLDRFATQTDRLLQNPELIYELMRRLEKKKRFKGLDSNKFRNIRKFKFKKLFVATNIDDITKFAKKGGALSHKVFVWDSDYLEYFRLLSRAIHEHSASEILAFFDIRPSQLAKKLPAQLPYEALPVEIPSAGAIAYFFSIDPGTLLRVSKVVRRDGWISESFQRLLRPPKLEAIKKFLVRYNDSFFPNCIVGVLDEEVTYKKRHLWFPDKFGVFTILDGQHRLYAFSRDHEARYYRGKDPGQLGRIKKEDARIRELQKEFPLLVCGLRFPQAEEKEKLQKEARFFVDINRNQTPVPKDLIFNLASDVLELRTPEAYASATLDLLNKNGKLKDSIQVRSTQKGRLKKSSLVQWGLRDLFDSSSKYNFFTVAPLAARKALKSGRRKPFLEFARGQLELYLAAIEQTLGADDSWKDLTKRESMLMSAASMNGFLRLYRHFIKQYKRPSLTRMVKIFEAIRPFLNFRKQDWHYTASGWALFERDLLNLIRSNYSTTFGDVKLLK
ncbi:MAG: DGQHR domain-containing protein [Nitrososphaerota archaeon]|nr:DGQHR domain-containing protein [Nitrososphaerota archaeon]